ncbi:MAG: type II toxin-antitoxin system death-on-curing family toxin [Synergistaceae bacterium]|nr:type II toxin-antitoxin system death-on-curing family toxin [Synergistaceae bacterium]
MRLPTPEIVFDEETVIALHDALVARTGGSEGVRDMGLLSSAIYAPFQSFGGCDVYPTIYEKAARFAYGLVQNHAFIDGNKRIAAHAMLVYLKANGIALTYTQKELEDIFLGLASSEVTFDGIVSWLKNHASPRP